MAGRTAAEGPPAARRRPAAPGPGTLFYATVLLSVVGEQKSQQSIDEGTYRTVVESSTRRTASRSPTGPTKDRLRHCPVIVPPGGSRSSLLRDPALADRMGALTGTPVTVSAVPPFGLCDARA